MTPCIKGVEPIAKAATWDVVLRRQLKLEHGRGWSIGEQSGKIKLTRRYDDGTRNSVMLTLRWAPSSASAVVAAVAQIRTVMDERNLGLTEAHSLLEEQVAQAAATGAINWDAIAKAFLDNRGDRRDSTLRDLRNRITRALISLDSKPKPRDGRTLMRHYAEQHFERCPAGGQGRRRHLGDVAAFLDFAVERAGVDSRWRPLKGEELLELIGTSDKSHGDEITPPIKPEQLAAFLDALENEGKKELHLAVSLVGLFGLRPAELAVLRVEDDHLYVGGQVKRNRRTMARQKPDRLVLPLDIPGREGEGSRALSLYARKLVVLPKPILTAVGTGQFKAVGDAFRQLLDRHPVWKELADASPGLTPYSLRHGYAWRAHKAYSRPLSIRDAAALMGHNPITHHKHYGKWTDEKGLIEAVKNISNNK